MPFQEPRKGCKRDSEQVAELAAETVSKRARASDTTVEKGIEDAKMEQEKGGRIRGLCKFRVHMQYFPSPTIVVWQCMEKTICFFLFCSNLYREPERAT